MGTLTIGLFSSLSGSMNSDFAIKLAEAAVEKGHKVVLWLSGNATVLANKGQKEYKDYSFLYKRLNDLIAKGVEVGVCEACAEARGIHKENCIDGANWVSIEWYLAKAAQSDRVLHIGSE